jgi:hypothetical protein
LLILIIQVAEEKIEQESELFGRVGWDIKFYIHMDAKIVY